MLGCATGVVVVAFVVDVAAAAIAASSSCSLLGLQVGVCWRVFFPSPCAPATCDGASGEVAEGYLFARAPPQPPF